MAVGGGGDRVLVAADDGKVRLYDFATGESFGFAAGDARGAAPAQRPGSPTAGPVRGQPGAAARAVDDDVHFAVYRPKALTPGDWAKLLVFTHKTSLVEQPGEPPMDPNKQVEARALADFGDSAAPPAGADARYELPRGSRLRVVPELQGIECDPAEAVFEWWEPVHEAEFRIRASQDLAGSVSRGAVRIWRGALIVAEVFVAIPVTGGEQAEVAPLVASSAAPYRKIFASYSRDDLPLLASFTEAAYALGDTYLQDVISIRAGELWEPRLLEMIHEADIFQLFWSSNSMRSKFCRNEWEYALSLRRPLFVRPVYWEQPLPQDLTLGLPPASLRALQFVPVRLFVPQSADEGAGQPAAAPSQVAPAAPPASPVPAAPRPEPVATGQGAPPAQEAQMAGSPPREQPPPDHYYGTRTGASGIPQGSAQPGYPAGGYEASPRRRGYRRPALAAALVLVVVIAVLIALHAFG